MFFPCASMCLCQCLWTSNFFEYGGVFLHASVNESVSVCVCGCIHSDYRLWYSASSLTLVYAPITTAEREIEAKEAVKSDRMPQSKIPPCQATSVVAKQEIWHNIQSNIERRWRKTSSSRGGRNGISEGGVSGTVAGERKRRKRWEDIWKKREKYMLRWFCVKFEVVSLDV